MEGFLMKPVFLLLLLSFQISLFASEIDTDDTMSDADTLLSESDFFDSTDDDMSDTEDVPSDDLLTFVPDTIFLTLPAETFNQQIPCVPVLRDAPRVLRWPSDRLSTLVPGENSWATISQAPTPSVLPIPHHKIPPRILLFNNITSIQINPVGNPPLTTDEMFEFDFQ